MTEISPALLRFKRALDLIPFISANPGWSPEQLAEHFGVSEADLLRDLVTLHMCGLPGYSHGEMIDLVYEDDYVEVTNPQNLARPRDLTADERTAILLGLEMMKQLSDSEKVLVQIRQLQQKLMGSTSLNLAQSVDVSRAVNSAPFRDVIMQALSGKKQLIFSYISQKQGRPTRRTISPTRAYQIGEYLYVEGFCLDSLGIRNFRTDRMIDCSVGSQDANIPEEITSAERAHRVRVLLDPSARLFLEENRQIVTEVEHVGDRILATFEIGDLDWLLSAILALPGSRAILEPELAVRRMEEIVSELSTLYQD